MLLTKDKRENFEMLLDTNNTLKTQENLDSQNIKLMWWEAIQLTMKYNKDKKIGFYGSKTAG